MSDLEINKQKKEYNTFLSACEFCKNNNVNIRTLSLMNYLNGIRVDRPKNDRPDIINRCSRGKTETVVGIEMFFVDQNSRLKKGQYNSKTREDNTAIRKVFDAGHFQIKETGDVSEDNKKELLNKIVSMGQGFLNSTYDMLISSFKAIYDKHANNAKEYLENIKSVSGGRKIELAFYIEIESYFYGLFMNYNNSVVQYKSKLMPFFSDIVSIINSNENKKYINYLIFDLKAHHPAERRVIAIRTGNIKNNLINQGITIFEYAGENMVRSNPSNNIMRQTENDKYDTIVQFQADNITNASQIKAFEKAKRLKENNTPFVTTRQIQELLYASKTTNCEDFYEKLYKFREKYPFIENTEA